MSRQGEQPQILIVEDDADSRETLRFFLTARGFRVATVVNGKEALDLLRSGTRPRVILLDMLMPVMDGWEFRSRQLDDPNLRSIPVVVTSAVGLDRRPVSNVGLFRKPLDLDALLQVVRKHTG
jgi:CheY-like chemotaxis protein